MFRTRIPANFDRLVIGTGHDRLAVGRKGHRADPTAVRVLFLRHKTQCGCEGQGQSVLLAMGWSIWAVSHPNPTLIVLSSEPETIVLPSGDKATESM